MYLRVVINVRFVRKPNSKMKLLSPGPFYNSRLDFSSMSSHASKHLHKLCKTLIRNISKPLIRSYLSSTRKSMNLLNTSLYNFQIESIFNTWSFNANNCSCCTYTGFVRIFLIWKDFRSKRIYLLASMKILCFHLLKCRLFKEFTKKINQKM